MTEQGTTTPVVAATVHDLKQALGTGRDTTRAVVMTMGALHDGHLALVHRARELADQVVVTIFVNSLQFGAGEDLDSYPRRLDADVKLLTQAGADVVFTPTESEIYPDGPPQVQVSAGVLGEVLEGAIRPGHFDGVLTIVLKLLHLTTPTWAIFGEKDAQQLFAVRRMVHDLDVPVEIVGVPTVREADGLARSSRNAYLSPAERTRATRLSRALAEACQAAFDGLQSAAVVAVARGVLGQDEQITVDYLELVDPHSLLPVEPDHWGPALMLVAARVGRTRLIDNVHLRIRESAVVKSAVEEAH